MEHISQHANNALTTLSTEHGHPQNTNTMEKKKQLWALLKQSFSTFNLFGKSPEDLENIARAFWITLEDCSQSEISSAFGEWLRGQSIFPTPAEIRKMALEYRTIAYHNSNRDNSIIKEPRQFVQVIRDKNTDQIIAEYPQGHHKSDFDLMKIFPGKRLSVSIRQG